VDKESMQDPEVDLLIIESLGFEFKDAKEIAKEIEIDVDIVINTLNDLSEQGMAIEKKGLLYRISPEEDE